VIAVSALAVLSLFLAARGQPAVSPGNGLAKLLGEPAFALRTVLLEPYLWILMMLLLAISLAGRDTADQLSPLDQAMIFALIATACGVVLAGNHITLATAILLFDAVAALFALTTQHPGRAAARLLLGILSSAAVVVLAQSGGHSVAQPGQLGGLYSLTLWLRLGLYPLVESGDSNDAPLPMQLGWVVVNLAVGLYLIATGVSPWLVWLAGATTLLHGALAWLESSQKRALAYTGYALAGAILTMSAAVGTVPGLVAASVSVLAAVVALHLTLPVLDHGDLARPSRLWAYLPLLLATASLIGVPFTVGWKGRGLLYQESWQAGALGTLALVIVAEGAALSVLYGYWQHLLDGGPAKARNAAALSAKVTADPSQSVQSPQSAESSTKQNSKTQHVSDDWYLLGATVACIPFLVPVLGPRVVVGIPSTSVYGLTSPGPLLGLLGSLLWALFLGYGRQRLLDTAPFSRSGLVDALHLGWLLRILGYALDTLGRVLLRIQIVIEGEHYLAWAILLALGLGLVMLLR
jgi:hypothetical protein